MASRRPYRPDKRANSAHARTLHGEAELLAGKLIDFEWQGHPYRTLFIRFMSGSEVIDRSRE